VLIVNIPKGKLIENAREFGYLKKYYSLTSNLQGIPDISYKI